MLPQPSPSPLLTPPWQGDTVALWVQHLGTAPPAAATKCANLDSAIAAQQHLQLGKLALRHQVWYRLRLGVGMQEGPLPADLCCPSARLLGDTR